MAKLKQKNFVWLRPGRNLVSEPSGLLYPPRAASVRFHRSPLLRVSLVQTHRLDMQFEILATCNTTRARVSRMKLPRESKWRSNTWALTQCC